MEVMLEIYKTLAQLNMQWRRKDGIAMPEIGPLPPGGYSEDVDVAIEQWSEEHEGVAPVMGKKTPSKKEASTQDKAAQGLYLVETRAYYNNVMVCLDHFLSSDLGAHLPTHRSGWICNCTRSIPPTISLISEI